MDREVRVENAQAIERTLNELRQTALTGAARGTPSVRATVLNLIAYAGTSRRGREMAEQAAALAEQHPSRAIILCVEPQLPAGEWEISVAAHCHPTIPGYIVCFEAVQVAAGTEAIEHVPAIAMSALVRDLPVVLWWPGDVAIGTPLFERLLAGADRLIVDSAGAADPGALLASLAALGHAEHCQCALSDLNWDRLTPWRELTAQFFDPPDCWPCLERLEHLRLEYLAQDGNVPTQVHLLVAWLATRLGWAPVQGTSGEASASGAPAGERIRFLRGRQPVAVDLIPLPSCPAGCTREAAAAIEIQRLVLHSAHPHGEATFAIGRSADGAHAQVTTELPRREVRERTVAMPLPAVSDLLGEELRRFGYDPIYEEALRLAAFLAAQRSAVPSTA